MKAAAAFNELRPGQPPDILALVMDRAGPPGDGQSVAEAIDLATMRAREAMEAADSAGIRAICLGETGYPPLLACVPDPPPVLWTIGDLALAARPCVAVVGSRAASPYALQVAHRLAAELTERGIVVVSGLARGVDSADALAGLFSLACQKTSAATTRPASNARERTLRVIGGMDPGALIGHRNGPMTDFAAAGRWKTEL